MEECRGVEVGSLSCPFMLAHQPTAACNWSSRRAGHSIIPVYLRAIALVSVILTPRIRLFHEYFLALRM